MDSELRRRFLQVLDWDLRAEEIGRCPAGYWWWCHIRAWWLRRDPKPIQRRARPRQRETASGQLPLPAG